MKSHQEETRAILWCAVPDSVEKLWKEQVPGVLQASLERVDHRHRSLCVWGPKNSLHVLHQENKRLESEDVFDEDVDELIVRIAARPGVSIRHRESLARWTADKEMRSVCFVSYCGGSF